MGIDERNDQEKGLLRGGLRGEVGDGAFLAVLAFTPDGKRLFSAGASGTITAWDVESGKLVMSWQGHSAGIAALCVSPDGQWLASGSDFPENAVVLWDAASGRKKASLLGHKNLVCYLAFNHDGSRLVSASWDQTARLWEAGTGRALATLAHRGRVTDASFRPDDQQLVTRGDDQTLRLWDAKTGEPLLVLTIGSEISMRGTAFSPDGKYLACPGFDSMQVLLWEVRRLDCNGVLRGHTSYVYDVAFRPDGTQIASAAWDGTVRIWDASSQQQVNLLKQDGPIAASVAFSPDGKELVSTVRDMSSHRKVVVWELPAGRVRYTGEISRGVLEDTRAVFNEDASFVAVATHRAPALLIHPSFGQASRVIGEARGGSTDIAFSTDGGELATAQRDGTVRLWKVATGTEVDVLRGHQANVGCVRYSPDGRLIASASDDCSVRLWDATTHAELAVFRHGCIVYGLAFSPDGRRLATACLDRTIRLWDIATHDEVAELRGHTAFVHAVAFSPDGTRLVSCSGDQTVRIWDTLSARERARRK